MAASIKISELNSLNNLTDVDLFLVSDMETGTSRKISYNNLKSNVITETASALSDLTDVVAQNRTDAEALVETVRSALQASIDGKATALGIVDDGFDARLNVLEADPVTKTYVDDKVSAKLSEVIDFAPESLDTLNELAEAMGDNPNLISTIDTRVTDLENSTAAADALASEVVAREAAIAAVQADVDQNEADADAAIAAVQADTNAAIAAVQADVDQNESDADAAIAAVQADANAAIAVVQADVDQNEADADAAIAALQADVNAAIAAVQADVDQNEADADAAIASVVVDVTTNTTNLAALQTTVDNLDIDIAPETLNSINELAGALGDDPQIITTLQAELTAYKAHIEERNLELALAFDVPTYAEIIYGG